MTNYYHEERTILTPVDTQIRLEGWLMDTRHILEPNADEVYSFSFQPLTSNDHSRLYEAGERACMLVEMGKDPYSNKIVKPCYEDRQGLPYCSQLFKPKLNVVVEHPDILYGKEVSIAAHFRDDPLGNVYLQVDYCDLYNGWDEPQELITPDDNSDDW